MPEELRVVSTARWLAQELAAQEHIRVSADLGLWLPEDTTRTAWWCPTLFAARLAASEVRPNFRMTGAVEATHLPNAEFLGRRMSLVPAGELRGGDPWFIKPADAKIPALSAQVTTPDEFRNQVALAGFGDDLPVIISDVVEFLEEYRAYVLDDEVVATSAYLYAGETWDAWDSDELPPVDEAARFAQDAAAALAGHVPAGYTLDVGRMSSGNWSVIETNPAWSSGPYWASLHRPDRVVATILASQAPGADRGLPLRVPTACPPRPIPSAGFTSNR